MGLTSCKEWCIYGIHGHPGNLSFNLWTFDLQVFKGYNFSNLRASISSHFQILRRELKTQPAVEYF